MRAASRNISTPNTTKTNSSATTAGDLISEIGNWLDEPMSDGSLIPTFLLARFVRKYVTVALGGDGGDELFAGYPMYYAHGVASKYHAIPAFIRSGLIEPVVNALPVSTNNMSFDYKAKAVHPRSQARRCRTSSFVVRFVLEPTNTTSFSPETFSIRPTRTFTPASEISSERRMRKNVIERMQYADINFYLAEDILTKGRSRCDGCQSRDAGSVPRSACRTIRGVDPGRLQSCRGKSGKVILKEAMKDLLPLEILHRTEEGFGIPIAEWLKGRLNPLMHDMLAPERLRSQGLFEAEYVQRLIREHEAGSASHHKELWTLLVFQLWFDKFLRQ
jgi:asparagine synthase (glutamine-hydrolysing)